MDMTKREAEPHFSQPVRQILTMLAVVGLVAFGAYVAFPRVAPVFLANIYLNGVILLVFSIGVLACFWQVVQLFFSVSWIEDFASNRPGIGARRVPRLLLPLATLLRTRGARMQISASSTRSILESVGTRIEEARDITRYLVNLLIFLGLLGTFYGLATTVQGVVDTIRSLAPKPGEAGTEVFSLLMTGLQAQLGGMGTAFSSSLLGLAGSLVLGLLELFAGHGQNRFYGELEEWLSTITRLGFSSGDSDAGETGEAGMVAAVLEQMSAQMDAMQMMFTQSDVSRSLVDERLGNVADAVGRLTTRLEADSGVVSGTAQALAQLVDGQERMIVALAETRAAPTPEPVDAAHVDAESRMRLRSIDVQLLRILEEISAGRQETLSDLRGDLATLTRTIRDATRRPGS